ncbi:MAG: alanine--tRNA ligase [Candidatus Omnitrophica bacterium]|nr:alanine--tRNA ligase [Candidatus Omnitrophota bacterium]
MNSNEIRQKFLDFFAGYGHEIVDSDSLMPANDQSVLFTSAGMNQFKEQFMGNITDFRRAASSQKCMRTADLVNVGKSPTHHTFFEMLGNFSFGDYFKNEAIQWAWEFITEVLLLPKERLWVSVHHSDTEAFNIWLEIIKINKSRIVKLGDGDNFWPANAPKEGPNGPCGPCSEIFFDWGEDSGCKSPECGPACDCGRFSEIWNLVFTQYDRQPEGSLTALPSKNIDTGMGLERIVSVMQNVRSNYETDLFVPILESLDNILQKEGLTPANDWLITKARAIADHIRAAAFAISDGIIPSNEARGYVIRKLIRRSIIYLKQIGVKKPLCYGLVYSIGLVMEKAYPEIKRRHETIAGIIKKEEEMFWTILKERTPLAEEKFKMLKNTAPSASGTGKNAVQAAPYKDDADYEAFILYDTFGVPLEVSKEIAYKYGHVISDDKFEQLMEEQRKRSRSATQISSEIFSKSIGQLLKGIKSEFVGFDLLEADAKVLAVIQGDVLVASASQDEHADIALDVTPFYAESGGQIGDRGFIKTEIGAELTVEATIKADNSILHRVKVIKGAIQKGDKVRACVITGERAATMRNHTATHLLQYALRSILGEDVEQSGSFVDWEKLRFDFNYPNQLNPQTVRKIEELVNACIWENIPVKTIVMDLEQAKNNGALAFFGEKYTQKVRVLSIGDKSKELCGGTHVKATGEIGCFKIVSESSVASGIRRIEAITGKEAFNTIKDNEQDLLDLCRIFKVSQDKLLITAQKAVQQLKSLEKEISKLKAGNIAHESQELIKQAINVNGVSVLIKQFKDYDMNALLNISDLIRAQKDPVICVLGSIGANKPLLLVGISKSLTQKGLDAVKIIKEITEVCGGGGGGKRELAQAGAKDAVLLQKAIKQSAKIIEDYINNIKI